VTVITIDTFTSTTVVRILTGGEIAAANAGEAGSKEQGVKLIADFELRIANLLIGDSWEQES
jgi:hypothetical protein